MKKKGQFGKAFSFFPVFFLLIIVLAVFFLISGAIIGAGKSKKDASYVIRERNAFPGYWNEEVLTKDFEFGADDDKQKTLLFNLLVSPEEKVESRQLFKILRDYLQDDSKGYKNYSCCFVENFEGRSIAYSNLMKVAQVTEPEDIKFAFLNYYDFLVNSYNVTKPSGESAIISFYYGGCFE